MPEANRMNPEPETQVAGVIIEEMTVHVPNPEETLAWSRSVDDIADFTITDGNVLAIYDSHSRMIAAYSPLQWVRIELKYA